MDCFDQEIKYFDDEITEFKPIPQKILVYIYMTKN